MKSQKRKPVIQVKQHITKDFKIDNSTPINPPTHSHENLDALQGSGYQLNSRQNIVEKTDINSY